MYNSEGYAMNLNNIDKNDMYVPANTMSFLGTLSPAGSSVDSAEVKMDQVLSPLDTPYESALQMMEHFATVLGKPVLKIIEQPVEKFRFRYKSEMAGTHGSLIGMSSDKIRKNTYPAVQLENYDDRAIIRCSIYQIKDEEPHAHRLVMKAELGEKDDPHEIEVSPERGYIATFKGMGIIHTAKKYLASELYKKLYNIALEKLQRDRIFRNLTRIEEAELKKEAENQSKRINLNTVRLKFEAFLETDYNNGIKHYKPLCPPVYSQGINNLKSALTGELKIVRLDFTTASCVGGQEVFILVEKVTKNNIKVRFFECDDDDNETWVDYGKFNPNDVHHQYAIVFKVPPYKDVNIEEPVNVCIQLERPTDGAKSEPRTFRYKPCEKIGRKRVRYCESLSSGELPATINNVSLGSVASVDDIMCTLGCDFFKDPVNLNSNEFDELVKCVESEYKQIINTDGCASTSASASVSNTDQRHANNVLYGKISKNVVKHLTALVRKNPSPETIEPLVEKLFKDSSAPDGNSALHCAILSDQLQHLRYFVILLSKMRHLNVINLQNDKEETALHLAVHVNDPSIVKMLLPVGANPNITDNNSDTPLNLAVKNKYNLTDYIQLVEKTNLEIECYGGHTPLHSAIKNGDLNAVKILVEKNADVNHKIPSSGSTALHLAIAEKNIEIVRFLLEETKARLDEENYSKVTPVRLAQLLLSDGKASKVIFHMLSDYVKKYGFESLMIKEEPGCDSSSEESDCNLEIKLEPNDEEQMQTECNKNDMVLLKNSQLTKECISELMKVLDGTKELQQLSKDILFEEIKNSLTELNTKQIFMYLYTMDKDVFFIRDLLSNYGANEAVKIIDNFYIKK